LQSWLQQVDDDCQQLQHVQLLSGSAELGALTVGSD
jgi:hypothetical protein